MKLEMPAWLHIKRDRNAYLVFKKLCPYAESNEDEPTPIHKSTTQRGYCQGFDDMWNIMLKYRGRPDELFAMFETPPPCPRCDEGPDKCECDK